MWGEVLAKLEKRINRPSFNTWIRPTRFVSMSERNVSIGVPDEVFVYWLGEHYVNVIVDALTEALGFQPEISFVVMDDAGEDENAVVAHNVERTENHSDLVTSPQANNAHVISNTTKKIAESVSQSSLKSNRVHESVNFSGRCSWEKPSARTIPKRELTSRFRGEEILSSIGRRSGKQGAVVSSEGVSSSRVPHTSVVSKSLNPAYNFDSYVVGSNNRLAHAAALAVADQMAVNYNPLFIYGGVGLGKTHLLHSIGNHLSTLQPNAKILYLSSEQFINELVFSIRNDRMAGFREKYRNIDLLLVDDIQFIARKERTQEEFFHTFNTLYQARKQIVLTSDCPPKKIPTIAEQLRSRFEWGLIADIQPPDLETRVAILQKKADIQHIILPDEVAIYIASRVKSNIRELEGSLSKMRAFSTFTRQEITLELAQKVLQDMFDTTPRKVTVELVQQVVANHYHIEPTSMKSAARSRDVTLPRQIAMYLSRELTNLSLPDIGRNFGGRDHTTVIHACKKVERSQVLDQKLRENIIQIRELIRA